MKEVVWVFGNSAAGKETFINYILENDRSPILNNLGLHGKKIMKSEVSTEYIGQYEGDPITIMRDNLFKEVPSILADADAVLIKWQTVDSESSRISKLLSLLPDARHRIIQVCTSKSDLSKRLPLKSWWRDDDISVFIDEENIHIQQWIDVLDGKLPLTKISGDAGANYSLLKS